MARKKAKTSSNQKSKKQYTGILDVSRSGTGFVRVEGLDNDILVHAENQSNALTGDTVLVTIIKEGRTRIEGIIENVLVRRQTEFPGRLEVKEHFAFLIPDKQNMPVDIFIPTSLLNGGKNGDHAVARITDWSAKTKNPVGEIISILTNESANEIAMQGILMDAGFSLHFPDEVQEEAARFSEAIDPAELKRRKDFRKTLTLTIDPADAKDFDDALSFKKLKDGWYEIGVHIADVSYFVQPGSALDEEAYRRATSVYLPDRVLPMLPEHLSNMLCSLRPNEEKYVFSAVFEMNDQAEVRNYWLGRSLIRSDRRYAYEEVQEIIEGADGDNKNELLLLNSIARKLREARFKKGAINFSSREVRFKLDENAKPIGIVIKENKEANQLIEEFMLLANRTVAEFIDKSSQNNKAIPFPYRVHDLPDEVKLASFAAFAARYGYKLNLNSGETIARSFNEMLQAVKGKPEQNVLESLGIRTMAKAVYTTQNIGHYGLGFADYCHFTSPIRRYPDVLVHRVLQQVLDNKLIPIKDMEQKCRHCSDQERNAMEAERDANKYKQVEYMQGFVGEEFEASITGVASFGFWAETVAQKCEGMVSMASLRHFDDFLFMEAEYCLVGHSTGIQFRIGDKVQVKVLSANLESRQIDYDLVNIPEAAAGKKTKMPPSKKTSSTKGKKAPKRRGKN